MAILAAPQIDPAATDPPHSCSELANTNTLDPVQIQRGPIPTPAFNQLGNANAGYAL